MSNCCPQQRMCLHESNLCDKRNITQNRGEKNLNSFLWRSKCQQNSFIKRPNTHSISSSIIATKAKTCPPPPQKIWILYLFQKELHSECRLSDHCVISTCLPHCTCSHPDLDRKRLQCKDTCPFSVVHRHKVHRDLYSSGIFSASGNILPLHKTH